MSEESYRQAAATIADALADLIRIHELDVHDGERCQEEAVNLIAFLSHRVGLHWEPPEDWEQAESAFRMLVSRSLDYRAVHQEHEH